MPAETTAPTLVRGIGTLGLVGAAVGFIIGSGVFAAPREVAAILGPWSFIAFLGAAVTMASIAFCFAEAAARAPASGGTYGFAGVAFGPYAGFVAGCLNWVSNVLAAASGAAAAADAAGALLPALGAGLARALAIGGWFGLIALVNIRGVTGATRFIGAAAVLKLLPLILFVGVGAFFIQPDLLVPGAPPAPADLGRGMVLALFMFTGAEGALNVSGEVRDPARTIPRAVAIIMAVVTTVYVSVQLVAQGLAGPGLASAPAPLAYAIGTVSPALSLVMIVGALVSILGYLASDMLSTPRLLYAFGRDGLLPPLLARVHPVTRAPHVAILTHALACAVLAITGSFAALAAASTLTIVCVYALGCAAALKLRRDDTALAGPVARLPGLPIAAVIAFAAIAWLLAQATRAEAVAMLAIFFIASGLYALRRRPAA